MPAITVEATTFALFGSLGDLALRKLFPALYQLDRAGLLNDDTRILALSRAKLLKPKPAASCWVHWRTMVFSCHLPVVVVVRVASAACMCTQVAVKFYRPNWATLPKAKPVRVAVYPVRLT